MNYFVTGATGFIGKRLVAKLLLRPESTVYILVRAVEIPLMEGFREYWGVDEERIVRADRLAGAGIEDAARGAGDRRLGGAVQSHSRAPFFHS